VGTTAETNAGTIRRAYAPRPITPIGVREVVAWRLKVYTITLPGASFDPAGYEEGLGFAASRVLPLPPEAPGRFGVGFCRFHQSPEMDYIVIAWWGRENELPIRVFLRERRADSAWRGAEGDESICVWDMQIFWHERNVWVETALSREGEPDLDAYMERTLTIEA